MKFLAGWRVLVFSYVYVVWIRVLERSCLARMATRYMVLRLERLSISIFSMSAAADLKVSEVLPEEDGFRYILVIMDDLSNFISLEPAEACTVGLHSRGYG